ncbi:RNA-binding protein [Limibaculum sp. M0105]|uniref:RNA-binding protein n=2 Tax=Thermohalobaculum xanthum TaxID=2753746 RepID=A0A8J7M9B7_9RHOB|nr:RNA-binding protein [Thermohalobaculum xanthum]
MTRGGRGWAHDAPERRCIASGESGPTGPLIRFVLGPDDSVVPDLAGKLPGRGAWLSADRAAVAKALKKNLFARAFRRPVRVAPDLADQLEALIARRLVDLVALARKAGQAVAGFEKVRARLGEGRVGVLVTASDAAADGRAKLARIAPDHAGRIDLLDSGELGLAFGRDFAIHAALDAGGIADRALIEAGRLAGFRTPPVTDEEARVPARASGKLTEEGASRLPDKVIDER